MLSRELKSIAQNLSVLYVEDEEDTRAQLTEILSMFFKNVVVAENGKEGVEKFKSNPVDLTLSDLTMPVMDGIEMLKEIFLIKPDAKTIVMTAHNTGEALLEKEHLYSTDILYKPIDIHKTLQLLYDVCRGIIKSDI
jgi:DNA-binding NtrC family response regulator